MTARRRILGSGKAPAAPLRRRTDAVALPVVAPQVVVLTDVPEDFISSLLKSCPSRYRPFRSGEYLHVSDLIGKCVRKIALAERHQIPMPPQRMTDSQEITFAQGDCIGDFVVDRVISGHAAKVYARWSCQCGSYVTGPMTKGEVDSTTCPACNTPRTKHIEMSVRDEELKVTGHIDLVLLLDNGAFYLTELKSIAADAWKELSRPLPEHVIQIVFYWAFAQRLGWRLTDRVSIVYTTKGMVFKGAPYKEFTIYPQEHLHRLADYFADAAARKSALLGGALPARTACPSIDCTQAKKCEMASLCFSQN